jgi:hypothetical protein
MAGLNQILEIKNLETLKELGENLKSMSAADHLHLDYQEEALTDPLISSRMNILKLKEAV